MEDGVEQTTTPTIGGYAHEQFGEVRSLFERRLSDGTGIGASVAVCIEGELVVDLWGGWADAERTRPWREDTLVNVYSVTKTMMAVTAIFLADNDVIDFDATVASYWPEFAQSGKGDIKVKHLMSHSAGLSGWRESMVPTDLYDWEKSTAILARQEPFWEPGTASGYHGFTQGYLVGEVVRRATGEMLGDVFRREIAEPLGADFHMGLDPRDHHRVVPMVAEPPAAAPSAVTPSELMINAITNPMLFPFVIDATGTPEWTGAHIYAAGGQGNGRSIAKVQALIANGGEVDGKRIISEAACRNAAETQIEGIDLILGIPARFAMGFGLPGLWLETPHPDFVFWPGSGGALSIADTRSRTSFGYAINQRGTSFVDPRALGLLKATWNAVGY